MDIPWRKCLRPKHAALLELLGTIVGEHKMGRIFSLYEETGLVEAWNGWEMWGDRNEDGTSRGPIPHSAVVAAAQFCLQKRLGLRRGVLLTKVGLVHDAFKRQDIELGDYAASHARSRQRLSELFGEEMANLAELSGHGAMPTVLSQLGDILVSVVFLVDNMVVGTTIVPTADKCEMLDEGFKSGRYPFNNEGLPTYGVPYFTFQRYLSATLEARVALRLGVTPAMALAERLRLWVVEDFGVDLVA
jgi:hypothetical protein